MRAWKWKQMLAAAGVGAVLLLPIAGNTQVAHIWSFQMLDSSSNALAGSLDINLGSFTAGSLPTGKTVDVFGRVTNLKPSTGSLSDNLSLAAFSVSSSSGIDGQPYFATNGGSFPPFLLDQVSPGNFEDILLGTFDESALLAALPADGASHTATLDFDLLANAVDTDGFDTGDFFDASQPDITPNPPSFTVTAVINTPGDGTVPEPGTLALLAGAGLGGLSLLRRRRA